MTTYTTISNAVLAVGKPLTSTLAIALRDNPIAITEGAVGAPRISVAALDASFTTPGGVGTYVLARRIVGTTNVAFGGTLAGSNLGPTIALSGASGGAGGSAIVDGAAMSGTWQAMGQYLHIASVSGNITPASTLWQRIV